MALHAADECSVGNCTISILLSSDFLLSIASLKVTLAHLRTYLSRTFVGPFDCTDLMVRAL